MKDFEANNIFIDYIKSNSVLRIGRRKIHPRQSDFFKFSWEEIMKIRQQLKSNDFIEVLKLCYGITDKHLRKTNVYNVLAVQKFIIGEITRLTEIENKELAKNNLSQDEEFSGVNRLQKFEHIVSLDVLANGDVLKYEKLLKLPYMLIFKQLCLIKTKNEIEKKYLENARKQNRTN